MATYTRLPSGLVQARVRRAGFPAQSRSFQTRAAAVAWATATEDSMRSGTWRNTLIAKTIPLSDLLDAYCDFVVKTKRGGGDIDIIRIKTLLRDELSQYRLSALTPAVLAHWRDCRLAGGAKGSTINRELNLISSCINWGRKELFISMSNPVAEIYRPKNPPPRDRRLEPGELDRLLLAIKSGCTPLLEPLVLFAIETAMRQGELIKLKWDNVDIDSRTALLLDTKNGTDRTVPLSSKAVSILLSLSRTDSRVFPISSTAVKQCWRRVVKRAGIDNLHFHDLRHEAVSRLAEKLPNLIELSAVTGHKDLRMLKRYYHPRASDLAKKLD